MDSVITTALINGIFGVTIAIIGLIGVIAGVKYKHSTREIQTTLRGTESGKINRQKLYKMVIVCCIIVMTLMVSLFVFYPHTVQTATVRITYPHPLAQVNSTEIVEGFSQNVPEGQVIWVFVHAKGANLYYPNDNWVTVQSDGFWHSLSYFGTSADAGSGYGILVVTANHEAQDSIADYFRDYRAGISSGMLQLPEGVMVQDRIEVVRNP
jgi:hypothetical protein